MNALPTTASEPSPEFNDRCIDLLQRWERGDLPFDQAAQELNGFKQEANSRHHLVDQGRVEQMLGYMEGYRGNLNESIHHFERARAFFYQVGNTRRIAVCDMNMGESYRYKGDFSHARALYEKAYEAFKSLDDFENEAFALCNKGQMLLSMGRLDEAFHDLSESYNLACQIETGVQERSGLMCELHHAMTLLYLAQEGFEQAWQEARAAFELSTNHPHALERGFANRAIAEVVSVWTPPEEGLTNTPDNHFQAAAEAFREIGAEGEIARTMFAQAKSLARRGRHMTAARKLQLAMVIFTRLGMIDDAAKAAESQLEILGSS